MLLSNLHIVFFLNRYFFFTLSVEINNIIITLVIKSRPTWPVDMKPDQLKTLTNSSLKKIKQKINSTWLVKKPHFYLFNRTYFYLYYLHLFYPTSVIKCNLNNLINLCVVQVASSVFDL
jgi:hypothetical protein